LNRITLAVATASGLRTRGVRHHRPYYVANLGLREEFEFDEGVAVGSDGIMFAFFRGTPAPDSIEHISFHLPDVATLRAALAYLQANGVALEDPGDEIGPEAPGSPNVGIWLHDPDGYRLELNVQFGAAEL
jgi:catechol 2,3-dioxygenase-like lactoylglutathione lyase family enzyme